MLIGADAGTTDGPGRAAATWGIGALPAQAEQAVLAGGQAEAGQCGGVDLLLGQVR